MLTSYAKLLSNNDLQQIHEKSLKVLNEVGIEIDHPKILKLLQDTDARVDFNKKRSYFPASLVEKCIASAPREFLVGAAKPNYQLRLPHPKGGFYTRCGQGAQELVDLYTNEFRSVTIRDTADWVRVVDHLENVDMCAVPCPSDVPERLKDLYAIKCALENTEKHIMVQPYSADTLEYFIEMAALIVGGKSDLKTNPIISMVSCALSPLSFKSMDIEILFVCSKYGIPIHLASLNSPGGTSPFTIAGSVVQGNVEVLAGIVLAETICPNTPVICAPHSFPLNMRTGMVQQATVEAALADAAGVQVIKDLYHLPTRTFGFATDAFLADEQSMIERTFFGALSTFLGADILSPMGNLGAVSLISIPQLVIDNDIVGMFRRLVNGITINDDHLAAEVIGDAARAGNFMEHEHTSRHCREVYTPDTFFRNGRELWLSQGRKQVVDRARERATRILEIKKSYLSIETLKGLEEILGEANRKVQPAKR